MHSVHDRIIVDNMSELEHSIKLHNIFSNFLSECDIIKKLSAHIKLHF